VEANVAPFYQGCVKQVVALIARMIVSTELLLVWDQVLCCGG
jgi:hypothetical protein